MRGKEISVLLLEGRCKLVLLYMYNHAFFLIVTGQQPPDDSPYPHIICGHSSLHAFKKNTSLFFRIFISVLDT